MESQKEELSEDYIYKLKRNSKLYFMKQYLEHFYHK